jgi:hypothetical protein
MRKRGFEADVVDRSRRVALVHTSVGMIHLSPTRTRLDRSILCSRFSRVMPPTWRGLVRPPSTRTLLHTVLNAVHDAVSVVYSA